MATWCVYVRQWLTVYTSDAVDEEGTAEAAGHGRVRFSGRVKPEEIRLSLPLRSSVSGQRASLQVFLPSLCGEWKSRGDAEVACLEWMGDAAMGAPEVVERGSARERELLDYGKKMLPGG